MGLKHLEGTPWHVERFTRKEGDKKRHRSRCIWYRGHAYCAWHFEHCWGAAHCRHYCEEDPYKKTLEESKKPASGNESSTSRIRGNKAKELARKLDEIAKKSEEKARQLAEEKRQNDAKYRKKFPAGKRIRHVKYGTGVIRESSRGIIQVEFDDGTEKKLSVDACLRNKLLFSVEQ